MEIPSLFLNFTILSHDKRITDLSLCGEKMLDIPQYFKIFLKSSLYDKTVEPRFLLLQNSGLSELVMRNFSY